MRGITELGGSCKKPQEPCHQIPCSLDHVKNTPGSTNEDEDKNCNEDKNLKFVK